MIARLLALGLILGWPTYVEAKTLKCSWSQKQQCAPGQPCRPAPLDMWAKVDLQKKKYRRCDRRGCDTYDALVQIDRAAFTNIDLPGLGLFVKIGPDQRATEVVSFGNVIMISQGWCK
jgi:hypothetical protein